MNEDKDVILDPMMKQTLDLLSDPITIVNKKSRIVHANPALARLCCINSPAGLIGKLYEEVKSTLFEDEETINHWKEQDMSVINNPGTHLKMLEVHPGCVNSPYTVTKIPLYNDKKECIGSVHHLKYLEVFRPNDFIRGRLPGSLLLNRPGDIFNERECEIIFLKLQGLTNKAIAEVLCRSSRTIENATQRMYNKAGVNHIDEFIDFCEKKNYHRYLPQRYLDKKRFRFDDYSDIDFYLG